MAVAPLALILRNQGGGLLLRDKNHRQRGDATMTQGILPFKEEEERRASGLTASAASSNALGS
jgi:hypothetical protein